MPQPDLDIWWRHPHLQNGVHAEKHEGRSLPGSLLRLEVSSIIIILIFVNRTLRRIKSSRLIGLVLHAVTLIFFKEHPSRSALCCDISVELSPFEVKSMLIGCGMDQSHRRKLHIQIWLWPGLLVLWMNVALRPWVGRSRVCFSFFTKIILEYFIKSMIYQILKSFNIIAYFIPRWSEDLSFDLKIQKIQVN